MNSTWSTQQPELSGGPARQGRFLRLGAPVDRIGRGRARQARSRGFTLTEFVVALAISLLIVGVPAMTFVSLATEHQRSLSDVRLTHQASLLQDHLMGLLRPMSATESVAFGDPIPGGAPLYRRIVVSKGPAPTYPRAEIYFDTTLTNVFHKPDRSVTVTEKVCRLSPAVYLRSLYFFPSLKAGGVADASTLNVYFELDDLAASARKDAQGMPRSTVLRRTFAVKMRNP